MPAATPARPAMATDLLMEQGDPRRFIGMIFDHWWLVLLCLLITTTLGAVYSILAAPKYRSSCRYEIYIDPLLRISSTDRGAYAPRTSEQILQERNRQVITVMGSSLQAKTATELQPKWSKTLTDLSVAVSVKPVRELESMFDINVEAADRQYALDFLTTLLEQYQAIQREQMRRTTDDAISSLMIEQNRIANELKDAQNKLQLFMREKSISVQQAKQAYDQTFIASLLQRKSFLKMEQTMLETNFPFLKGANTATIDDVLRMTMETHLSALQGAQVAGISPDTSVSGIDKNIPGLQFSDRTAEARATVAQTWQQQEELVARLKAEYEDLRTQYKPGHPRMVELKRQTDAAERQLRFSAETALKRIASRLDAIRYQEKALDNAINTWKADVEVNAADRAQYESYMAQAEHLKQMHDLVYARVLDARAANIAPSYNAVEPAHIVGMVWPNRPLIMAFSLALGLALGIGLAFLLDFLDTSILDIITIEERLGLPYLTSIPSWNRIMPEVDLSVAGIIVKRTRSCLATEVYRSLRTTLESLIAGKAGYILGVTSCEANEGKSLTAINLATTFAWINRKVLIVDGDLRRGRLYENLTLPKPTTGLTEYLLGKTDDWRSLILPTSQENLCLLPVGTYDNTAPELLESARMTRLIQELRTAFDLVIFDNAPIGRVIDATLIGRNCDGVMLVTRQGVSTLAGVRHALNRLKGVNLLGFVVNGIDTPQTHGYGKYYGYFRRFSKYGQYYAYSRYGYYHYYDEDEEELAETGAETGAKPAAPAAATPAGTAADQPETPPAAAPPAP
jgi:capsular exopolysaccharide synthesis family protein